MAIGRIVTLSAAVVSLLVASRAEAAVYTFTAQLSDHGGGYAGTTAATGTGTFSYDSSTQQLTGTITHNLTTGYHYGIATGTFSDPFVSNPLRSVDLLPIGSSPIPITAISLVDPSPLYGTEQKLFTQKVYAFIAVQSGPRIDGPLVLDPGQTAPSLDGGAGDAGTVDAGGAGDAGSADAGEAGADADPAAVDPDGSTNGGTNLLFPPGPGDTTSAAPEASSSSCSAAPGTSTVGLGLGATFVVALGMLGIRRRRRATSC